MQYGLLGETLGHSHSKRIHQQLAGYQYDLCSVPKGEIDAFLKKRDFLGLNVTIPYKKTVIPYCDVLTETAQKIGSVNTLVMKDGKLYGDNTDYAGFCYLAAQSGISFFGKKVLICGSGGTSLTVKTAAVDLGAREVVILSRSGEETYQSAKLRHADAEILVNTTPLGMYPNLGGQAVSLKDFPKLEGVLDVVYNPLRTALILEAKRLGLAYGGGLSMLVAQAKYAAEQFSGQRIGEEEMSKIERGLRRDLSNLVLIGMPGSGKTTFGQCCAEALGRQLVDVDDLIIERAGCPIPVLFKSQGEESFRKLESECIASLAGRSGLVISTGGGAVLNAENVEALRANGVIVRLVRPLSELPIEGRPISQGNSLEALAARREPFYVAASDAVVQNNDEIEVVKTRILEAFDENLGC